jgi:hypothetical protein
MLTSKILTNTMKKHQHGLTALASALQLKKGDLLELLNLSRPHAHMIDRGLRSMPMDSTLIAGTLQLALATAGAYEKKTVSSPAIDKKEIQNQLRDLNLKIYRLNRKIEQWFMEEQIRLKALAAVKVLNPDPTLPKAKRQNLMAWKKLHSRRLESTETAIQLVAAQARLAGLNAELQYWKEL